MASFRCSACDTSLDGIVRYCPECGAEFPVAYNFADQDTEPFATVRPRRPRRGRRSGLLALLALVVGGVALAVVAISTRPTFSAGSGGASSPTPAIATTRAAFADSEMPRSPATPTATATRTATASPTATASATATATPTSTPTSSPTPAVTAKEVIENGSFEDGDEAWRLDGGARVAGIDARSGHFALILPAGGGYVDQVVAVVAGAQYRLSAWAMLGAAGDEGEIGVYFLDPTGRRMTDQEPSVLTFTATGYERHSVVFTVPADVSEVRVIIWKSAGDGILAVDGVSLRGIAPGAGE
jgi:hypothetical protein